MEAGNSFVAFYSLTHPMAYGSSQARGQIGAVPAGLHTATATQDPSLICKLHYSSLPCLILSPLSEARDGASILMDTNHVFLDDLLFLFFVIHAWESLVI